MAIDSHERFHDEGDEPQVVDGRLALSVQQYTRVGGQRPVVVLATAVDPRKRFLVQQTAEPMLAGQLAHQCHEEHVVVHGQVALLEDGSQFKLVGSHLVVASLAGDTQFQGVYLQVFHESCHSSGYAAEVVVVHLLVLGTVVPHESAACHHQVGTCSIETLIHEEILLLPSQVGDHLLHVGVEIASHIGGSLVDSLQRLLQRSLVVESLAGIRDEYGGYHQRVIDDEDGRGGVPGGIAPCLEGGAYAPAGERTGIRFLLHESLAGELLHHAPLAVMLHEAVMLLCGAFGEGLKPMGAMGDSQLHGPFLHAGCHGIGGGQVEGGTVVHDVAHLPEDIGRQVLEHLLAVEDILGKILTGTLFAVGDVNGLLAESLPHHLES